MTEEPTTSASAQALALLKAARDLLARDGGWTQSACARDAAGHEVDELSDRAVAFDPLGAITRAGRHAGADARAIAMAHLRDGIGFKTLGDWNDAPGRTQAEAVALLDAAIAATGGPSGGV